MNPILGETYEQIFEDGSKVNYLKNMIETIFNYKIRFS